MSFDYRAISLEAERRLEAEWERYNDEGDINEQDQDRCAEAEAIWESQIQYD